MKHMLLLTAIGLFLCSCHHVGETHHHRTVSLIAYDDTTNAAVAVFTITQSAYDYADDSEIYLTVKNLSSDTTSFNFNLNFDGKNASWDSSFTYTNAVVELPPGAVQVFGRISEACLNIYDSNIYLSSPFYVVYQPNGPG